MPRLSPIGVALAAAIAWLPVAPPEHVHEVDDHGHAHALVHRHVAAHDSLRHSLNHDGVLDEHETPVFTAGLVLSSPTWGWFLGRPADWTVVAVSASLAPSAIVTPESGEPLIHGPPGSSSGLRAPPAPSRL